MEVEEPDLDFEESEGLLNRERKPSGDGEAESSGLVPAYPVCVPQGRWEERGGEEDIQEKLLRLCCTAEDSFEQTSPSSMLEYWLYSDNQRNMADCPIITPPATPVTHRPCPFMPVPSAVTAAASAESSVVKSVVSGPVTDTCGPISSVCSPTSSAWDTLRSTSDRDPVSAAAHLHLLGESLSLIGHHLQETNKAVSMSSSVALLLDSLLCALAPLLCLTAQIPELKSCTQHTLPSTLENISYLMPGL
ncbi:HMG box-containing protein 4 [Anarrhichthys ocellatus]|uniref:HMG box-containing protein 4 n=1 Tax=Anarrhichthys ocellatus TaxID=433405 RepID=UPI0012ED3CB3|nr:HMG box-containing protein 4-like [Anarrhichthys ocellatus]